MDQEIIKIVVEVTVITSNTRQSQVRLTLILFHTYRLIVESRNLLHISVEEIFLIYPKFYCVSLSLRLKLLV